VAGGAVAEADFPGLSTLDRAGEGPAGDEDPGGVEVAAGDEGTGVEDPGDDEDPGGDEFPDWIAVLGEGDHGM